MNTNSNIENNNTDREAFYKKKAEHAYDNYIEAYKGYEAFKDHYESLL